MPRRKSDKRKSIARHLSLLPRSSSTERTHRRQALLSQDLFTSVVTKRMCLQQVVALRSFWQIGIAAAAAECVTAD
jgi:hypothetical protein